VSTLFKRVGTPRALRQFAVDQAGATAVEFGSVALPFIALMLAILETALLFFATQTLETAVSNTARLIRTGQAQQLGFSADQFKEDVCSQIMSVFDCEDGLYLDVRKYATFDSIDLAKPIDDDGNLKKDFAYQMGHGGDIVVVRAYYEWPTFSRLLGLNLSNLADGNHLIAATAAFRNEPFPW
jgi:Flp pilus assembly protein TadG